MKHFEARIVSNREVAPDWRELVLACDDPERPRPGQFLTLRVSPRLDPLLRRPFAYASASADGSSFSMLYQVRGNATAILADLGPGARVDAIGPLGRGFPSPAPGELPLLAAGGIGLGPVLFLARELSGAMGGAATPPLLALGFRDAASVPRIELPPGAVVCTDDGSSGRKGFPSDWISHNVSPGTRARIFGCGPGPMLASLAALAAARGWAASLSAEQWMACGVGACMGCALPRVGGGYLRACADGPVFELGEIDWKAGSR